MRRLLCNCLLVEEHEVVAVIRAGARTVDAVGDACDAGTGCGSCRGGIEVLIEEEARRRRSGQNTDLAVQLGLFDRRPK